MVTRFASATKERDTLLLDGVSPMKWGRAAVVAAWLGCIGIAACTGLAGIGGFEVDPCFDGGCEKAEAGMVDQTVPEDDAGEDASFDAGTDACACPTGTSRLPSGFCAIPTGEARKFITCEAPLIVPDDCTTGVTLQVCDEDLPGIKYPDSICDGGQDYTLPSVFIQLGTSHTSKWISEIQGSFGLGAAVNCAQVSPQCIISPLATKGVTNTGANNKVEFAIAKHPDAGCEVITFKTQPYTPPDSGM